MAVWAWMMHCTAACVLSRCAQTPPCQNNRRCCFRHFQSVLGSIKGVQYRCVPGKTTTLLLLAMLGHTPYARPSPGVCSWGGGGLTHTSGQKIFLDGVATMATPLARTTPNAVVYPSLDDPHHPCLELGAFLAVQSVPTPRTRGVLPCIRRRCQ